MPISTSKISQIFENSCPACEIRKEKDFMVSKSYPELSKYFFSYFGEKGKERVLLNYIL